MITNLLLLWLFACLIFSMSVNVSIYGNHFYVHFLFTFSFFHNFLPSVWFRSFFLSVFFHSFNCPKNFFNFFSFLRFPFGLISFSCEDKAKKFHFYSVKITMVQNRRKKRKEKLEILN